jgi:hypothetical protein
VVLARSIAGFIAWALAGALCALTLLGAASIGLFVLPFAGLAVALLATRGVPGMWGLGFGIGLLILGLGLADALDGIPQCTGLYLSDPPSPGHPSECESGGLSSTLLIAVGAVTAAGCAVGHVVDPQARA